MIASGLREQPRAGERTAHAEVAAVYQRSRRGDDAAWPEVLHDLVEERFKFGAADLTKSQVHANIFRFRLT